jgi:hypothetical protein
LHASTPGLVPSHENDPVRLPDNLT